MEEPTNDVETRVISVHVDEYKNDPESADKTTEKVKSKKGSIYREVSASSVRDDKEKTVETHDSVE